MKKITRIMMLLSSVAVLGLAGCAGNEMESETTQKVIKEETSKEEATKEATNAFTFVTQDIAGNEVTMDVYKDAKVVMLNFWEPWCGPCVGEMPSLAQLYDKYKDQGLVILGVFSTEGEDDSVKNIMSQCGTTYPILRATQSMVPYMTEYVPTTVFFDGKGNQIVDEAMIGSRSYDDWEKIIVSLLNQ